MELHLIISQLLKSGSRLVSREWITNLDFGSPFSPPLQKKGEPILIAINSGLDFMAGFRLKFRNSVKKDFKKQEIPALKIFQISRNFCFNEIKFSFRKICQFLSNADQFLNVHGNFLLLIRSDSFPIFPGIECNSIQKFRN